MDNAKDRVRSGKEWVPAVPLYVVELRLACGRQLITALAYIESIPDLDIVKHRDLKLYFSGSVDRSLNLELDSRVQSGRELNLAKLKIIIVNPD